MGEDIYIQHNRKFYNTVTDAWVYILGRNFHYGYFKEDNMPLDNASDLLIELLASHGTINECSSILDVGCGIGTPAIRLAKKFNCRVTGISTSQKGVELANVEARHNNVHKKVFFKLADALNNELEDNLFDFVWQMESSHLIANKEKLFSENYRVLNRKGKLLLCDLILKEELSFAEIFRYRKELYILEKTFGKAKMITLDNYKSILAEAGFKDIETIDISQYVYPTPICWRENIFKNNDIISQLFGETLVDYFIQSCDILSSFFKDNILGYAIVTARRD